MKHIFTHWKTSLAAVLVVTFTVMVYLGTITVEQWVMAMGSLGGVIGLIAKDWDKQDQS